MKNTNWQIAILLGLFTLVLGACGDKAKKVSEEAPVVINEPTAGGLEYSATFQCVTHCPGSGSESFGTCPVCGKYYMYNPSLPKADSINKALSKQIGGLGFKPQLKDPEQDHKGHDH
jgi:hypothetical protein